MSKTRPKPEWWSFRTYGHLGRRDKQIEHQGQRRLEQRLATTQVVEETAPDPNYLGTRCDGCGERYCDGC